MAVLDRSGADLDDGDTILTLRHTGLPPVARGLHRSGWSHFLPELAGAAGPARHG